MPGKAKRMQSATSGIAPPALGVMIRDSHGASSAACWTYKFSGGMREAQDSLPDAAWLTNLSYSEARTLDLEKQGGPVRADGWLGAEWRKICAEWDLTDSAAVENAEILSCLATRVVSIAQEALAASDAARNPSFRENLRHLPRRPSLATGIRRAFGQRIRSTAPKEQLAADAARSLHQSGIRGRTSASSASRPTVSFHAHFPRFEFAEALASEPVPQPGPWQAVKLASPGSPLSEDALDVLARLGRPVFAAGEFRPNSDSAPPWHRPPAPGGGTPRSAFTLEEIRILIRHGEFRIREAFAGSAWSANGSLLGECVELLAAACGGRLTARTSWSAGLAADNLVRAVCVRQHGDRNACPMESAWAAARERIAMSGAIEAAERAGGLVTAASAGTLDIQAPGDPGCLSDIAAALCSEGVHLPAGAAKELRRLGATLPDAREFKGTDEARLLEASAALGGRGLRWRLDEALGVPARLRRAATLDAMAGLRAAAA